MAYQGFTQHKIYNLICLYRKGTLIIYVREHLSFMYQQFNNVVLCFRVSTVVEGLLEVLSEPKCNGAVLSISPMGTKYVFPKMLANKL